jgi:hypothetical protein
MASSSNNCNSEAVRFKELLAMGIDLVQDDDEMELGREGNGRDDRVVLCFPIFVGWFVVALSLLWPSPPPRGGNWVVDLGDPWWLLLLPVDENDDSGGGSNSKSTSPLT